jgi:hypothetical protein
MTGDIRSILDRLNALEGKITPPSVDKGLNPQQKSVNQLPALFKPKEISVLGTKKDPTHPMHKELVGDSVEPKGNALEEAMVEIEEDMLSKVKRDLTTYLDQLEKSVKVDRDLKDKAVDAIEKKQAEESDQEVAEDPTTQDLTVDAPAAPVENPVLPEAAKIIALEDGTVFEVHGNEVEGFEIRHGERTLPTRFPKLDHAQMAVDLFRSRKAKQAPVVTGGVQDYIDEA